MKPEHLVILLKGRCPKCDYENNSKELQHTGSADPYYFRVICANCKHPFIAHLEVEGSNPKKLIYLDFDQLFQAIHDVMLKHKRQLAGYVFLKEKYPQLFWNLLHHHSRYSCGIFIFRLWQRRYLERLHGYKIKF